MAKPASTNPFRAMEVEAADAFLEWPVWLVLREKELAAYLSDTVTPNSDKPSPRPKSTTKGDA